MSTLPMDSNVNRRAVKPPSEAALQELTEWAALNLDTEILSGKIKSIKEEPDAARDCSMERDVPASAQNDLTVKTLSGVSFRVRLSCATQTCNGFDRRPPATYGSAALMLPLLESLYGACIDHSPPWTLRCCAYVLDRIVHFWKTKTVQIGAVKMLEHCNWNPANVEDIDMTESISTMGALIQFHQTVARYKDELARRALLVEQRAYVLGTVVTQAEMFEGLDWAYQDDFEEGEVEAVKVLKRILLSVLVRNGVEMTMGEDEEFYMYLVRKYPDLATDFGRGLLYYHQVYSKKEE